MTGDYMTKPVYGKKFTDFRNEIMNLSDSKTPSSWSSSEKEVIMTMFVPERYYV